MSDVIIIGGGPAGSTLGSYLSKAGITNTIIESSIFPRDHVGESLVTSTTRVFEEIGFLDTMESEGFVHKYGASWHAPAGKEFKIEFREFPQEGINQDYTYHVNRSKFDQLLLKHAEKLGSKIYQGVHVKQVMFDGNKATGVQIEVGGKNLYLPSKVVVDASGRGTILGRQLNLKVNDPIFNQFAVHAWFKDLNRGTGPSAEYIHIYFLPIEQGWVWQIPITEEITSVGVVTKKEDFKKSKGNTEEFFMEHVHSNPDLSNAISSAERINDFKMEGDYSYSMKQIAGDGFMMVGDAARFVDPIFSSGVSIAVYSAKFAAREIIHAFEIDNFSRETFLPYEKKLMAGAKVWYEFIRLYYKLIPLFTHFIQSEEYRLQILQLLQGEVFDRDEVPVLDSMREYIKSVEVSENHLFRKHLSPIPLD